MLIMMVDGDANRGRSLHAPKMAVLVAEAIAEDIFKRGLKPGMMLPNETQMIRDLGVGRGTLREALRLLEAQGLVRVRPGPSGGPVVQQPQPERLANLLSVILRVSGVSFGEIVDARELLEPALAAQAALRRDDDDLAKLNASQEQLRQSLDDEEAFLGANRDFHSIIARASRNRPLLTFWAAISAISDGHEVGVRYDAQARRDVVAVHDRIARAIEQRNAELAETAMRKHMVALRDYLAAHYPGQLRQPVQLVPVRD